MRSRDSRLEALEKKESDKDGARVKLRTIDSVRNEMGQADRFFAGGGGGLGAFGALE